MGWGPRRAHPAAGERGAGAPLPAPLRPGSRGVPPASAGRGEGGKLAAAVSPSTGIPVSRLLFESCASLPL